MKAVIVIDMPDDVSLDEWYAVKVIVDRLKATEEEMMQGIPFDESKVFKFIPLKPLPKQFTTDEILMAKDVKTAIEMRAYNDCLEEILGENE